MYERIFGKYPQVKVINYLLVNPEKKYTKKEIAVESDISRVTLDSFITDLLEMDIIQKEGSSYVLNLKSKVVKILIDTQIILAELIMQDELAKSEEIIGEIVDDEEFEEFMNSFDYEVNLDDELKHIESNETIEITRKEYEMLKNRHEKVLSSHGIDTNFFINAYYPEKFDKRMINYG